MKNRKAVEDSIYLDHNPSGGNVHMYIDLHRERKTFAIHTLAYKREVFLSAMSRSCNGHKKPRKRSFSFFATAVFLSLSATLPPPHGQNSRGHKRVGEVPLCGRSIFIRYKHDVATQHALMPAFLPWPELKGKVP